MVTLAPANITLPPSNTLTPYPNLPLPLPTTFVLYQAPAVITMCANPASLLHPSPNIPSLPLPLFHPFVSPGQARDFATLLEYTSIIYIYSKSY